MTGSGREPCGPANHAGRRERTAAPNPDGLSAGSELRRRMDEPAAPSVRLITEHIGDRSLGGLAAP